MTTRPRAKKYEFAKDPETGLLVDEHGCKIGEEVYDFKQGKCVPMHPRSKFPVVKEK